MYFIDALYGKVELDIPQEIIRAPELQRLREIRLCNINSPFITGGTTLNRFEHAVGTAYLAQEISRNFPDDHHAFIIAALLHDIVTAPFGHSLEYLFESLNSKEYEHANIWQMIFTGRTIPSTRYFFAMKTSSLHLAMRNDTISKIQNIFEMNHPLARLLTNQIDIDNIDNVFRFAYHIGIEFDKKLPLLIASNLKYEEGEHLLIIKPDAVTYFEEWFNIRKLLYKFLLEDEGEFVAKSLLERAFIECFKDELITEYDWVLTDNEIVQLILHRGNDEAKKSVQRLMLMDFPKHRNIYYSLDYKGIDQKLASEKLRLINYAYDQGVLLHFIRDVKKTCRQLIIKTTDDLDTPKTVGCLKDRYLIGVFSDSINKLKSIERYIKEELNIDLIDIRDNFYNDAQISLF